MIYLGPKGHKRCTSFNKIVEARRFRLRVGRRNVRIERTAVRIGKGRSKEVVDTGDGLSRSSVGDNTGETLGSFMIRDKVRPGLIWNR